MTVGEPLKFGHYDAAYGIMLMHINSIFIPLSWITMPEQSLTRPAVQALT
jgi:hypothetical protein